MNKFPWGHPIPHILFVSHLEAQLIVIHAYLVSLYLSEKIF